MSEQRAEIAMEGRAERLRRELRETVDLIRRSGGGLVFEEFPGALHEEPPGAGPPDEAGASPIRAAPGRAVTAHRALLDAADALAETLAQLDATWRMHPLRFRATAPISPAEQDPAETRGSAVPVTRPGADPMRPTSGPRPGARNGRTPS